MCQPYPSTNLQDMYLEAIEWAPEQEVAWEDGVGEAGQRVSLQIRQQGRVHRLHAIIIGKFLLILTSVADPGYPKSRIPDPNFFHPGSRIRIFSILDLGSVLKNLRF